MRLIPTYTYGAILAGVVSAQEALPLVDSVSPTGTRYQTTPLETRLTRDTVLQTSLRNLITQEALMAKAQLFEDFAYSTAERNRVVGSPGLDSSLQYVVDTLTALDYYNVTTQNFTIPQGSSSLIIHGTTYVSSAFTFSPAGSVVAQLVPVANLGCNAAS